MSMRLILATTFALCIGESSLAQDICEPGQADLGLVAAQEGLYDDALALWRPCAAQGDPAAQFGLGLMYSGGFGVQQDLAEAARWYLAAAERGNTDAQTNLGNAFENGFGVPQDYASAARWYALAAKGGHPQAQSNLGGLYLNGLGVPRDYAIAARWFELAAEQGIAIAQNNLGGLYFNGYGVDEDLVLAHMWFNIASIIGTADVDAAGNRDLVARQMTPGQIAEAEHRANEWIAANGAAVVGPAPAQPTTPPDDDAFDMAAAINDLVDTGDPAWTQGERTALALCLAAVFSQMALDDAEWLIAAMTHGTLTDADQDRIEENYPWFEDRLVACSEPLG